MDLAVREVHLVRGIDRVVFKRFWWAFANLRSGLRFRATLAPHHVGQGDVVTCRDQRPRR